MQSELASHEPHHHHRRAHVASHIPGRLRIKLGPASRTSSFLEGITRRLRSHSGVHQVTADPTTGSVTVHYDPGHQEASDIKRVFQDCGVIVQDLQEMADSPSLAADAGFLAAV